MVLAKHLHSLCGLPTSAFSESFFSTWGDTYEHLFIGLRQSPHDVLAGLNSLCKLHWPQTYGNPPVSAF